MTDSSSYPRGPVARTGTLLVLCAVALMIVLDSTIVAVAVPTIQLDLGFSAAGVAWVVNGYLVAFGGLLLLAGRLGDLVGARRIFLAGVAVFTVASLLCGLATSAELLVLGRFAQGAGGALASAVVLGMIVRLYPEPAEQARAMGVYSFVQAGGAAIGFVAGGLLTEAAGWPWIFLVNVPFGVAVLVAGLRLIPREQGLGLAGGMDVPGAILVTAGLSLGVYAIVRTAEPASTRAQVAACATAALLLVAGFEVRQRFARRPLIPPRVLANRWVLTASTAVVLLFATGMGFQFFFALFVQRIMGFDALRTGLAFLPTPVVIGVMSLFVAPRVTGRYGRRVLTGGLAVLAAGMLVISRAPAGAHYLTDLLPGLVVMGLGFGVVVPAIIMLAMAGAAPGDTGAVSGLINTAQQAGGALGLSVLAAVAAARTDTRAGAGAAEIVALRDGYSLAFLVATGFVLGALILAATALRNPPSVAPVDSDAGGDPAAARGAVALQPPLGQQ